MASFCKWIWKKSFFSVDWNKSNSILSEYRDLICTKITRELKIVELRICLNDMQSAEVAESVWRLMRKKAKRNMSLTVFAVKTRIDVIESSQDEVVYKTTIFQSFFQFRAFYFFWRLKYVKQNNVQFRCHVLSVEIFVRRKRRQDFIQVNSAWLAAVTISVCRQLT